MADFIRKNDNLELNFADLFPKNSSLESKIRVPKCVFQYFKLFDSLGNG